MRPSCHVEMLFSSSDVHNHDQCRDENKSVWLAVREFVWRNVEEVLMTPLVKRLVRPSRDTAASVAQKNGRSRLATLFVL
ncbi:hypothetical protein E4U56_003284 [Claviceps arundinis]|uniref:Uncharacterized protein n=1 Tax=Claviceps arundinis TaxID=1623583 RepID=A0A9P7MQ05_9HYPO|nr:hypothetical protein E4U56_003284 [Claviceps arundinis]